MLIEILFPLIVVLFAAAAYCACGLITGYTVYYGTASGTYDHSIVTGSTGTSYQITSLPTGTYYFAVTASLGEAESTFSNEVSKYTTGTVNLAWDPPTTCTNGELIGPVAPSNCVVGSGHHFKHGVGATFRLQ